MNRIANIQILTLLRDSQKGLFRKLSVMSFAAQQSQAIQRVMILSVKSVAQRKT